MCKICDRQNQWVCDCGAINRVGSVCECGLKRTGQEVGVEVYVFDERRPNRATRRGSPRAGRW